MHIHARRYTTKSGQERVSYSLVDHQVVDGKYTSRSLLNLGQEFSIPKRRWPQVVRLVQESFSGLSSLELESGKSPEAQAARTIIKKLQAVGYKAEIEGDPYESIGIQRIDYPADAIRSTGGERVLLHALEQIGFKDALHEAIGSRVMVRLAMVSVIAHLLKPPGKSVLEWLNRESSVLELMDMETYPLTQDKVHRAVRRLWGTRRRVVRRLIERNPNLFPPESGRKFRDLTQVVVPSNIGGSRGKLDGLKKPAVCWVLDEKGFLRGCRFEKKAGMKLMHPYARSLRGDGLLVRPGAVSDPVLRKWTRRDISWVCINDDFSELENTDLTWHTDHKFAELRLYASPNDIKVNEDIEPACQRFEEALEMLHDDLVKSKKQIRRKKVLKRVAKLRHDYSLESGQYDIHLDYLERDLVSGIGFTRVRGGQANSSDPLYRVRTNITTWDRDQLVEFYLRFLENRQFMSRIDPGKTAEKSDALAPDWLVKMNAGLSIIAYTAVLWIRATLKENDISMDWPELRSELSTWSRVNTILTGNRGEVYMERQDTHLAPHVLAIVNALGIKASRQHRRAKYEI